VADQNGFQSKQLFCENEILKQHSLVNFPIQLVSISVVHTFGVAISVGSCRFMFASLNLIGIFQFGCNLLPIFELEVNYLAILILIAVNIKLWGRQAMAKDKFLD